MKALASLCKGAGLPEPSLLDNGIIITVTGMSTTVKSPNIARPLTLHTSPSGYGTLNQIKFSLIFNIELLLEREKQQKVFT